MKRHRVAVVGATGAVGKEILAVLADRHFPIEDVRLLGSGRFEGRRMGTPVGERSVDAADHDSFAGIDVAFFAAGSDVARELAPSAVRAGAVVIDNSSAFRMDPEVPLVVPEVNPDALDVIDHAGIVANPNCSTIVLVVVLKPIADAAGLERVVVSTYQAVSGVGSKGIEALERETRSVLAGEAVEPKVLPYPSAERHRVIAFNVVPHVDQFGDQDYSKEEWKMVHETRKILADPGLRITATTVRVPVFRCHAETVNLELKRSLDPEHARELLHAAPGVSVRDDPGRLEYPTPLDATGLDDVYVGRIRRDDTVSAGLNLWLVGDQLRKGAALNAVQIAEALIEKHRL
ncbi:MAG: aspartate-semialdehyde dehydrogenase [Deltaproteobacteria bacterium]|nr:aspartate-semialdehyde dehydrogenase [Deltaproteobacteria bacterium]